MKSIIEFLQEEFSKSLKYILYTVFISAIFTIVAIYLPKFYYNIGEPKIEAFINSVVISQDLRSNKIYVQLYYTIFNLQEQETILKIGELKLELEKLTNKRFIFELPKRVHLKSYGVISDTIHVALPLEIKEKINEPLVSPVNINLSIYYPTDKKAKSISFNRQTMSYFYFEYKWKPLANSINNFNNFYKFLLNKYKKNKLNEIWKQGMLNFKGKEYDYFYTPISTIPQFKFINDKIFIETKSMSLSLNDKESNKGVFNHYIHKIIPNPSIINQFINLNYREININYKLKLYNDSDTYNGSYQIKIEEGFRYFLYFKLYD